MAKTDVYGMTYDIPDDPSKLAKGLKESGADSFDVMGSTYKVNQEKVDSMLAQEEALKKNKELMDQYAEAHPDEKKTSETRVKKGERYQSRNVVKDITQSNHSASDDVRTSVQQNVKDSIDRTQKKQIGYKVDKDHPYPGYTPSGSGEVEAITPSEHISPWEKARRDAIKDSLDKRQSKQPIDHEWGGIPESKIIPEKPGSEHVIDSSDYFKENSDKAPWAHWGENGPVDSESKVSPEKIKNSVQELVSSMSSPSTSATKGIER